MPMPTQTAKPKPPGKLGTEKLTPEEQKRRFIEAGASENEADFDAAVTRIAKPKAAGR